MFDKAKEIVTLVHLQGGSEQKPDGQDSWIVDVLLPGLFTILLLGGVLHVGYCMAKAQLEPTTSFHYAISAFPM